MKIKNRKVKLFVNSYYSVIICLVICIIMVTLIVVTVCMYQNELNNFILILFICVLSVLAVMCLIGAILSYQTATISEEGILFQTSFRNIGFVKWLDIVKVEVKELPTYHSTFKNIKAKWIVLYTDFNQQIEYGGGNARDKVPWQIKYSHKNALLLSKYLEKNCQNIYTNSLNLII